MRTMLLAALLTLAVLAAAPIFAASPQTGTAVVTSPTTGGAPTGYRIYVNDVLANSAAPGLPLTATVPGDGSYKISVEAFNATGPGPRVSQTHLLGQTPGPVTFTFSFSCATTTPPTCTDVIVTTP